MDESGDHSLDVIDQKFPVFALSFCVVKKADYVDLVVPAVQNLKFKYWGHDAVILHEHDIGKRKGDFAWLLLNQERREAFMADIHQVVANAPMILIGSVIRKTALLAQYINPWSPYELALQFCLERLLNFLLSNEQNGKRVHVVFECRGNVEDNKLEQAFRRIVGGKSEIGHHRHAFESLEFEPKFAKKSVNSTGLQLADLTARPMAQLTLRPDQPNRTFGVLQREHNVITVFP